MNQSPKNALHSKFHLVTGDTVTRDEEYEHLQVGSTTCTHDKQHNTSCLLCRLGKIMIFVGTLQ